MDWSRDEPFKVCTFPVASREVVVGGIIWRRLWDIYLRNTTQYSKLVFSEGYIMNQVT